MKVIGFLEAMFGALAAFLFLLWVLLARVSL